MKIKIHSVELNVQVAGQGQPFVWAHGLTGSMSQDDQDGLIAWQQLLDLVQLVRYDARGHGESQGSPNPVDYRWDNLAKDMLAAAEALNLGSFIAGGSSMGCATALYAALQAPERVRAVVLAHPPTAWETRAAKVNEYEDTARFLESKDIAALVAFMRTQPMTPAWLFEARPEAAEMYFKALSQADPRQLALLWRGAGLCNLPQRAVFKTLHMPALILAWEGDPGHPLSTAEELASLIPDSRLVVARSIQDLEEWTGEIKSFISALS